MLAGDIFIACADNLIIVLLLNLIILGEDHINEVPHHVIFSVI
jgi:hypothetical protein